jgi:hypothetical protein
VVVLFAAALTAIEVVVHSLELAPVLTAIEVVVLEFGPALTAIEVVVLEFGPALTAIEVVVLEFGPALTAIEVVVRCNRTEVTVLPLAPAVAGMTQNIANAPNATSAMNSRLIVFSLIPPYTALAPHRVYTLSELGRQCAPRRDRRRRRPRGPAIDAGRASTDGPPHVVADSLPPLG